MSDASQKTASTFDNWTVPISQPGLASCLAYGMVWQSTGSTLHGFDHFTGKQTHAISQFGANRSLRFVQPYDDGLLVYADDGYLYKADLTPHTKPTKVAHIDNDPSWMMAYRGSVYLASHKNGLQRVPPASEDFMPGPQGRITLPYGEGTVIGQPSFGDGYLLVPMQSSQVDAVDAASLEWLWSAEVPWGAGYLADLTTTGTSFNGEYFSVASDRRAVSVVSVSRRKVAWTKSFAADIGTPPVCDLKYCYVSLTSGQLFVLSVIDGSIVKTITLPGIWDHMVVVEEIIYGVLNQYGYAGGTPPVTNSVFALSVATGAVATVDTGSWAVPIAVDNGVYYYHSNDAIAASRPGQLVRSFYAEAMLLQDFDFSGGASGSPEKPLINTEITVFDNDGTPQPLQHVRVGATAPVTIESRGETYSVSPSAFASIPTDASGRLRIGIRAGEPDKQNQFRDGLTCPGLTLFTTFMSPKHRILIRPDAQLHDKLAGMKDDGLATAVGYDNRPILRDAYQGDTNQKAVVSATQMIKSTLSMVKTSVDQRNRRRTTRDDYLASGCDTEVICCCHDNDYAIPMTCTRNFAFDLKQSTFMADLDERQTEDWLAAHQPMGPARRGWDDYLWEAIKTGTATITDAVIYVGKQAKDAVKALVTAVIDGVAQAYHLVLETIEQAVAVVHGIFNEIVGAIDKVLQAFSFAFSWPAIVELKNQIRDSITGTWDTVLTGEPSQYDRAATAALAAVGTFRATADQAFAQIKTHFGEKSVAGERKQAVGGKNPAADGAADNWLQAKMSDNLLSERALQQAGGQTRSTTTPIVIPDFVVPDGVIGELQGLFPKLGRLVTKDTEVLFQRLAGDLAPGSGLDVFSATVNAIIEIIRDAVNIAIDLAREALATLFRIIKIVLKAARDFVTQEIKIPFISDLYRHFTGGPLTILDLGALLIAVPSSLAIAALTLNDRYAKLAPRDLAHLSRRDTQQVVVGIIAGVAQVGWAFVSAALELFNLVVEKRVAKKWVERFASKINVFLLVSALFLVRGVFLASEVWEATDHEKGPDNKGTDWGRVAILWLPSTLAAAIDVVAALAKAWVLGKSDTTDHETFLKSVPYLSAGGDFICGFADLVLASKTLATATGAKGENWDYFSHLSEDLSLILRPFILLAAKLPAAGYAQAGLIALSSACLLSSGVLKIVASSPGVHERSATA